MGFCFFLTQCLLFSGVFITVFFFRVFLHSLCAKIEVEIYDETDDAGTITWVFDLLNGKALFLFKFPEDYPLSPPKITCFAAERCTGFTKKSSVEFDYSRFSYSF